MQVIIIIFDTIGIINIIDMPFKIKSLYERLSESSLRGFMGGIGINILTKYNYCFIIIDIIQPLVC